MVPEINEIQGSPEDLHLNQSQGIPNPIFFQRFPENYTKSEVVFLIINH